MTTKTEPLEMALEILNLAQHDFDLCREYVAQHVVHYRRSLYPDYIFIRRHGIEVMLLRNGRHGVAPNHGMSWAHEPLSIEDLATVLTES